MHTEINCLKNKIKMFTNNNCYEHHRFNHEI